MVNKLFFCLSCIIVFKLEAQTPGDIAFHSTYEKRLFFTGEGDLAQQLMADARVSEREKENFSNTVDEYVQHLITKQAKYRSGLDFVSMVFYKTHRKFLKRYRPFTSFAEMLRTGNYDCLSATTLYSILLDRLQIDHEVVETTYHIYMNITTPDGQALIESTDPIYGFESDPKEIKKRLESFYSKAPRSKDDQYLFATEVHDRVSPTELVGLQYYNASIEAYNRGRLEDAIDLLQKALFFRRNPRMNEFGLLLAQTVLEHSTLSAEMKSSYINRIARELGLEITLASR